MKLRPYQKKWLSEVFSAFAAGHKGVIGQMPTGAGKTVSGIARPCELLSAKGEMCLILAHRIELVKQASRTLGKFGIRHHVLAAENYEGKVDDEGALVWVAMVQTLHSRLARVGDPLPQNPRWIFVDECHRATSKTYARIYREAYPDANRLGLTATPCRLDGTGFESFASHLVVGPRVKTLTEWGMLVPARCFTVPLVDLAGIKRSKSTGEYILGSAAETFARQAVVGSVVEHYVKLAGDRKGLVFCCDVDHSTKTAAEFNRVGIKAAHIDGNTHPKERAAILERLEAGELQVVCNCQVLTEGLDITSISAISLAAPTMSLTRYLQEVGRGARPSDGKSDYLVIDHAGCVRRHGTPDYSHEWTLRTRTRREVSLDQKVPGLKCLVCKKCALANPLSETTCAGCGTLLKAPRGFRWKEGELVEVKELAPIKKRQGGKMPHWLKKKNRQETLDFFNGGNW